MCALIFVPSKLHFRFFFIINAWTSLFIPGNNAMTTTTMRMLMMIIIRKRRIKKLSGRCLLLKQGDLTLYTCVTSTVITMILKLLFLSVKNVTAQLWFMRSRIIFDKIRQIYLNIHDYFSSQPCVVKFWSRHFRDLEMSHNFWWVIERHTKNVFVNTRAI